MDTTNTSTTCSPSCNKQSSACAPSDPGSAATNVGLPAAPNRGLAPPHRWSTKSPMQGCPSTHGQPHHRFKGIPHTWSATSRMQGYPSSNPSSMDQSSNMHGGSAADALHGFHLASLASEAVVMAASPTKHASPSHASSPTKLPRRPQPRVGQQHTAPRGRHPAEQGSAHSALRIHTVCIS